MAMRFLGVELAALKARRPSLYSLPCMTQDH